MIGHALTFPWRLWVFEQLSLAGFALADNIADKELWWLWRSAIAAGMLPLQERADSVEDVTVPRSELIERLTVNRATHVADYESAIAGWRVEARAALAKKIEELNNGGTPALDIELIKPQTHAADYDAVIDMLNMSADDKITISPRDFRRYARDEWEWKGAFVGTNSRYSDHSL